MRYYNMLTIYQRYNSVMPARMYNALLSEHINRCHLLEETDENVLA